MVNGKTNKNENEKESVNGINTDRRAIFCSVIADVVKLPIF